MQVAVCKISIHLIPRINFFGFFLIANTYTTQKRCNEVAPIWNSLPHTHTHIRPRIRWKWAIHIMTREHKVNACDNISRVILIPLLSNAKPGENLRQKLFDSNLFFKRLTTILIIVRKAYFHIIAMRVVYTVHGAFVLFCCLPIFHFSLSNFFYRTQLRSF